MITSFGSKETEKIWNGDRVQNLPKEIQQIGRRKLRMLNNSQNLMDLRIPPSNKLKKLSGKMSDFYSIRIIDQWRSVFRWDDGNSSDVTIIDYHKYTAIRLSYYFGNSAKFWLGLQNDFELEEQKKLKAPEFKHIKKLNEYVA